MTAAPGSTASNAEGGVIAGKYRLESLLGEGGMGAVWRAFNLQLEVPVAIKLLRSDLDTADLGERLRVEARAAAKLVHPGIVRIFDIGESDAGDPFIVMELLNGESLASVLARGALPAVNALQLLLPIAEALSLAHSRGVVHRDLKPDNIFIACEGSSTQPKLLDFGIAKVTSGVIAGGPTLTQTGTLLGSPDYMSPEQAYARNDVDERADIWAFCVVLYEALAGRPPFLGDSPTTILRSVVQDEPPPLTTLANVDPGLAALVQWGLAKDRDARPSSIFELGRELSCWLFAQGVTEDATGASLEAKWLGRPAESVSLFAPASLAPRAQHEHATLVSVVHPSPRPSSDPIILPLRRRQRWLPALLAAGLATAAAAAAFVTITAMKPMSLASAAGQPQPVSLPAPLTRSEAVSPPAPIAVSELPPLPTAKAPVAVSPRYRAPTRNASANRTPPAASLPRALPAETAMLREKRTELLNPY